MFINHYKSHIENGNMNAILGDKPFSVTFREDFFKLQHKRKFSSSYIVPLTKTFLYLYLLTGFVCLSESLFCGCFRNHVFFWVQFSEGEHMHYL